MPRGESPLDEFTPGAIAQGESVFAIGAAKPERVQQVSMMVSGTESTVPKVVAGNMLQSLVYEVQLLVSPLF